MKEKHDPQPTIIQRSYHVPTYTQISLPALELFHQSQSYKVHNNGVLLCWFWNWSEWK